MMLTTGWMRMFYFTANLTTLGRSDKKLCGEGAWLTGTLL